MGDSEPDFDLAQALLPVVDFAFKDAADETQKRFSKNSAAAGTSITNAIEPCAVSPMTRALIWLRAPPYASCAGQTVLAHRGRWRRVRARPE